MSFHAAHHVEKSSKIDAVDDSSRAKRHVRTKLHLMLRGADGHGLERSPGPVVVTTEVRTGNRLLRKRGGATKQ